MGDITENLSVISNDTQVPRTLEELNAEEARRYVGGAVFVGILMIVGIVGNIHVLILYAFRFKPSNHRSFILCLAVLDFITCSIGMPFVIYDLMYPMMFFISTACKILRFINYFMCTSSALVLLVIAVDRYRKICRPLSPQMSPYMAQVMCGVAVGVALVMSWPAPVLYGHSTIETEFANVTGVRCFTEDKFKKTKFQAYFNILLIFVVVSVFTILVVLYSLIGKQIWKRRDFKTKTNDKKRLAVQMSSSPPVSKEDTSNTLETPIQSSTDASSTDQHNTVVGSISKGNLEGFNLDGKKGKYVFMANKTKDKVAKHKKDRTKKTTFMLFMITVVFFCSFIPHLTLKIVTFLNKAFVPNMNFAESFVYNTFIWCFFINNMANPIIYGFCDIRFRKEFVDAYARLFGRVCRR